MERGLDLNRFVVTDNRYLCYSSVIPDVMQNLNLTLSFSSDIYKST